MRYRDLRLHFASISREIIDIIVLGRDLCTIIVKLFTHRPPERLTKVPPVMSKFWVGKGPRPECCAGWSSTNREAHGIGKLTKGSGPDFVSPDSARIMTPGAGNAPLTARPETEAATWSSCEV